MIMAISTITRMHRSTIIMSPSERNVAARGNIWHDRAMQVLGELLRHDRVEVHLAHLLRLVTIVGADIGAPHVPEFSGTSAGRIDVALDHTIGEFARAAAMQVECVARLPVALGV